MYTKTKHRIFGLDFARALAILMVLCSHSTILLFPNTHHFLITFIQFFGTIGVDLFFVLSGFLIGGLLLKEINKNDFSLKKLFHFWIRRWFRTLPNYFLVLVINILLLFLFSNDLINGIGLFFVFLQNFSTPHPNFFTEAWSLSIEEFAYLVGPMLVFIFTTFFSKLNKTSIFIIVTCMVILGVTLLRYKFHLAQQGQLDQNWSKQLRKVVIYRIDAVYYGFIGAFIYHKFYTFWVKYKSHAFFIGFLLFFGMHTVIFIKSIEPKTTSLFFNLFYLPLISISLLFFFPVLSQWNSMPVFKKQITNISLWSYSLYLVNYSIVLLSIKHFVNVEMQSNMIKLILLIGFWLVSFILSFILFKFFEKPTTDLRDSPFLMKYF